MYVSGTDEKKSIKMVVIVENEGLSYYFLYFWVFEHFPNKKKSMKESQRVKGLLLDVGSHWH